MSAEKDRTAAADLKPGDVIEVRPGETAVVASVETRWARVGSQTRTEIGFTDLRSVTLRSDYPVKAVVR